MRYGSKTILLDSGGTLNGILLKIGLVSDINNIEFFNNHLTPKSMN